MQGELSFLLILLFESTLTDVLKHGPHECLGAYSFNQVNSGN